jgi:hypothetical protein
LRPGPRSAIPSHFILGAAAFDTHDAASGCAYMDALRLVSEVRRLRQLVIGAEPNVPDNEQTQTINLVARLKADADRP